MGAQTSNIYPGQLVPTGPAALAFTTLNGIINGLTAVPNGCVVLLTSLVAVNNTSGVITLQLWRGPGHTAATELFGQPINIPPSSQFSPNYQCLSAPIVLMPGDSIWGAAGTNNDISISGDGQVITQ